MNQKQFLGSRIAALIFVGISVALAFFLENIFLAFAGIIIGVVFMFLVRRKIKPVLYDERIKSISGEAARATYVIVTIVVAFLSLVFLMVGKRTADPMVEALGSVLSYVAMFSIIVYAVSFTFFNRQQK